MKENQEIILLKKSLKEQVKVIQELEKLLFEEKMKNTDLPLVNKSEEIKVFKENLDFNNRQSKYPYAYESSCINELLSKLKDKDDIIAVKNIRLKILEDEIFLLKEQVNDKKEWEFNKTINNNSVSILNEENKKINLSNQLQSSRFSTKLIKEVDEKISESFLTNKNSFKDINFPEGYECNEGLVNINLNNKGTVKNESLCNIKGNNNVVSSQINSINELISTYTILNESNQTTSNVIAKNYQNSNDNESINKSETFSRLSGLVPQTENCLSNIVSKNIDLNSSFPPNIVDFNKCKSDSKASDVINPLGFSDKNLTRTISKKINIGEYKSAKEIINDVLNNYNISLTENKIYIKPIVTSDAINKVLKKYNISHMPNFTANKLDLKIQ